MDATRKTVIVTDSSCDLSDEQLSRYGIRMISLRIVCQNAEYRDRIDIQEDELYELLTRELPKTSLPLPEDVTSLYESLAQEGVTDVIHMSISSGLSGTFNMVRMITQDFESRMRVHMVDSRTLSMGLGMMVLAAARALEEGATPEEAIERAQAVRRNQLGMFVIRTLEFLRKGGRIGKVEGVVGSLLQIKPIIYVNDEGIYATLAKARGYKSAVDTMVSEVKRFLGGAFRGQRQGARGGREAHGAPQGRAGCDGRCAHHVRQPRAGHPHGSGAAGHCGQQGGPGLIGGG
jgi:DegV family protein with EDD domain